MPHRLAPILLTGYCFVALTLTTCRSKPEAEVTPVEGRPTDPALIRTISYEVYENLSERQGKAYVTDFSLPAKPSSRYTIVYQQDKLGRILADSTTYLATIPVTLRTSRYTYGTDRVLRTRVAYGTTVVTDTIHLNQQGRIDAISLYWEYNFHRRFWYTYDPAGHVIAERQNNVTDCNGMFYTLSVTHTVENQNRTTTQHRQGMGWLLGTSSTNTFPVSTQISYEYDLSRPNPGLPYDDFKWHDACSGVLSTVSFHPGINSGLSKNRLKRVIVRSGSSFDLVTQYDYAYEYDVKQRLKTVYIAVSRPGAAPRAVHTRTFDYAAH